ncbi:hypothetical protein DRN52_08505, partial [Thermococci archaeon]
PAQPQLQPQMPARQYPKCLKGTLDIIIITTKIESYMVIACHEFKIFQFSYGLFRPSWMKLQSDA